MDSTFKLRDNTLIITLGRELDHHNADMIKSKSEEYICKFRIQDIVFDFDNTNFMDSSGIGVIMGRYKVVSALNGRISVVNVHEAIERIFIISGLYKLVERYDNVNDAVR